MTANAARETGRVGHPAPRVAGMVLTMLFDLGWILPWLWQLGGSRGVLLVVGAAVLGLALPERLRTVLVLTAALILVVVGGYELGGLGAAALAPVALWRGRDARLGESWWLGRLLWVLVALGALVIWDARWWWALVVTPLLGVAAMSETVRPAFSRRAEWWRLGGVLASLAAAAGLLAGGLAAWAPWARITPYLLTGIIAVLETFMRWVTALIPRHLTARKTPSSRTSAKTGHQAQPPTHPLAATTHVLEVVLIGAGVLALIAVALVIGRSLSEWRPKEREDERLTRERTDPPAPSETVRHTRRAVARQMGRLARRGKGARPSETLREWLRRTHQSVPPAVAETYERVRYGSHPDSAEQARTVESAWPREDDGAVVSHDHPR